MIVHKMNDDVYHTLHIAFCQAAKAKKTSVSKMFQAGRCQYIKKRTVSQWKMAGK